MTLKNQIDLNENRFMEDKHKAVNDLRSQIDEINDEFKQFRTMADQETTVNEQIRVKNNQEINDLKQVISKFKRILTVPRLHTQYLDQLDKVKSKIDTGETISETTDLYYLSPKLTSPEHKLYTLPESEPSVRSRNSTVNRVRTSNNFVTSKSKQLY